MNKQPRFEARWYYGLSLDQFVPEDHLLRHHGVRILDLERATALWDALACANLFICIDGQVVHPQLGEEVR
jgi:hypothetical protein